MSRIKRNGTRVSVIIPVQNEARTIGKVLLSIQKLQPYEIVIVLNGSTDKTKQIIKRSRSRNIKLIEYAKPLGHNVGRAIGAFRATGNVLLFLDGDIVFTRQQLMPFINAIKNGHDLALNDLRWCLPRSLKQTGRLHSVSVMKMALNSLLKRSDLSVNSMVAVPHALSRKAIQKIGWSRLMLPPLAQSIAIRKKLSIAYPCSVNVVSTNRFRPSQHRKLAKGSPFPVATSRILGDHLEAISQCPKQPKVYKAENILKRIPTSARSKSGNPNTRSAVISVRNGWSKQTERLIQSVKSAGCNEIIAVISNANRATAVNWRKRGAKVFISPQRINRFGQRALGAAHSTGRVLLFIDDDVNVNQTDLKRLIRRVQNGSDLAIFRNLKRTPMQAESVFASFLNMAMHRPHSGSGSMIHTPFCMNRRTLNKIGIGSLVQPAVAYVKAGRQTLKIHVVSGTSTAHRRMSHNLLVREHMQALQSYLQRAGRRGGFHDGPRNRSVIAKLKG